MHFVHGGYLQDWLLEADRFLVAPRAGQGRRELGDWRHRLALVRSRRSTSTGRRIVEVLADLTTVVATRLQTGGGAPRRSRERGDDAREPFRVTSEDLATVLVRFEGGAQGCVVGRPGVRRPQERSVVRGQAADALRCDGVRSSRTSCGSAAATRRTGCCAKDPSLLAPAARAYAHLPGGHQEAWADAFCNVMRDIYGFIAAGQRARRPRPPAFATFEDGYHAACLVDAVLESHRRGGVWTKVQARRNGRRASR